MISAHGSGAGERCLFGENILILWWSLVANLLLCFESGLFDVCRAVSAIVLQGTKICENRFRCTSLATIGNALQRKSCDSPLKICAATHRILKTPVRCKTWRLKNNFRSLPGCRSTTSRQPGFSAAPFVVGPAHPGNSVAQQRLSLSTLTPFDFVWVRFGSSHARFHEEPWVVWNCLSQCKAAMLPRASLVRQPKTCVRSPWRDSLGRTFEQCRTTFDIPNLNRRYENKFFLPPGLRGHEAFDAPELFITHFCDLSKRNASCAQGDPRHTIITMTTYPD